MLSVSVFKSVLEPIPSVTILSYELGSVLIVPNGVSKAQLVFNEILLKVQPTSEQISQLRERLFGRNAKDVTCEICDGKLKIKLSLHIPRLFPFRRMLSKSRRLMSDVSDWAKPMTERISDDILGDLRWNNPDFEGRLYSGQSKIKTDLWIDVFVESGERSQEALKNIARLRHFLHSWCDLEPLIKKEIMHTVYPEYQRCCDERRDVVRHDEIGFWSELSVLSLSTKMDGSIVVRYYSGEMFGSYRVEAAILGDRITCSVTY